MADMVLLHEDETHFNLIVSKTSNLARMGSLSYRFNIGPMMKTSVVDEVSKKENGTAEETSDNTELVFLKTNSRDAKKAKIELKRNMLNVNCEIRLKKLRN